MKREEPTPPASAAKPPDDDALKACLSCGAGSGEALLVEHDPENPGEMRVTCCECGACGPWEASFISCYASWNALAALRARMADLERVFDAAVELETKMDLPGWFSAILFARRAALARGGERRE